MASVIYVTARIQTTLCVYTHTVFRDDIIRREEERGKKYKPDWNYQRRVMYSSIWNQREHTIWKLFDYILRAKDYFISTHTQRILNLPYQMWYVCFTVIRKHISDTAWL